jgi:hypothetical protein
MRFLFVLLLIFAGCMSSSPPLPPLVEKPTPPKYSVEVKVTLINGRVDCVNVQFPSAWQEIKERGDLDEFIRCLEAAVSDLKLARDEMKVKEPPLGAKP